MKVYGVTDTELIMLSVINWLQGLVMTVGGLALGCGLGLAMAHPAAWQPLLFCTISVMVMGAGYYIPERQRQRIMDEIRKNDRNINIVTIQQKRKAEVEP